jgi:hypothetical protein
VKRLVGERDIGTRMMLKEKMDPDFKYFIIVGVGRSGTSLLHSMLNAHPQICCIPEINFVRRFLAETKFNKYESGKIEDIFSTDTLIKRLEFSDETLHDIIRSIEGGDMAILYKKLLLCYAERFGSVPWIGDKDPRTIEYLPIIHRVFPNACVIHIIRDPRDVLSSKKNAAWSKGRMTLGHIFANRVQIKIGKRQGEKLFGDHYIELRYEDLIRDPHIELENICSVLGLEFDTRMLRFAEFSQNIVAADEMQWKKETLGPLLSSNLGKWVESLSPWEVCATEELCVEQFSIYGYDKTSPSLNFLARLVLKVMKPVFALAEKVYTLINRFKTN